MNTYASSNIKLLLANLTNAEVKISVQNAIFIHQYAVFDTLYFLQHQLFIA